MRARLAVTAAAALAVSASGCASGAARSSGVTRIEPEPTGVLVENHNWADMNVYVERSGARTRLGTVTAATSRLFRLPRALSGIAATFRLVADPIGGSDIYVTAPVQVTPGQRVNFSIANRVNISSVWISNH
jgi:hypothetical protein